MVMKKKCTLISVCMALVGAMYAQSLVHYWNFNNPTDLNSLLSPTYSLLNGAGIQYVPGTSSALLGDDGSGFDVTNPNARNGDASLTHLRLNNPIGSALELDLPTTGFEQVVVKYATRRSGSGAGRQIISFSTDGVEFDSLLSLEPVNGDPTLQILDFSTIPACHDNPLFRIRITFEIGVGGSSGNNRFDNLTVEGSPIGMDVFPPTVSFFPAAGSVNVDPDILPALVFNEPIRLISGNPVTNADIPSLLQFSRDSAMGVSVGFSGEMSGNSISILPSAPLENGVTYFLTLLPNTVTDLAGNALTEPASTSFSVLPVQTFLQPGDILPVAYRMNASGAEDEIALLTLVNILPGTLLNITDTKYTDNPQPQCPGGLTWSAPAQVIPAGSVFSIRTGAGLATLGTVTGSSFGLGSGGDQVIVYTGTPSEPVHVTALSSNAWTSSPHTGCSGSFSLLPAGLSDGSSAIQLGNVPGNASGNTPNAYYAGVQSGSKELLRQAVLNPENWIGAGSGTLPQLWPSWHFPGPPQVTAAAVTSATTIRLVFNNDLDSLSAVNPDNYAGIPGLASAAVSVNGMLPDTVVLTYDQPFALGASYGLVVDDVLDADNRVMLEPFLFEFEYVTKVSFTDRFQSVSESDGSVLVPLTVENPSPGSTVELVLKPAPFRTADDADVLWSGTLSLSTENTTQLSIPIDLVDDLSVEQDEYFVLALEHPVGLTIEGSPFYTVYIRDDDRQAPTSTGTAALRFLSRYSVPNPDGAEGIAEIVAYDPASHRLFAISTGLKAFDIIDFSQPAQPVLLQQVPVDAWGGGLTSIAVKDGIVAVSVSALTSEQDNGSVLFFDVQGNFLKQVSVGALPDMVTFSPDGRYVLVANEGQPSDDYSVDPEGSVTLVDISQGIASLSPADIHTAGFHAFDAQAADLQAAGLRWLYPANSLSQDLEPEYITVSDDSKTAWVSLQENNAVAVIDIPSRTVTDIWPLGTKDFSAFGNGLDLSDRSGAVHIANYPLKGFFLPDGIAHFSIGGQPYLLSANEGDEREYAGLNERTTVGAVALDPTAFPQAAVLQENHNMGRFRISNLHGDEDGDGDFDELFCVGTRSFSVWNATDGSLLYDSGDAFETITAANPHTAPIFNADNEGNGFKSRSRAKGPEPEGVTVATVDGRTYAFITLERIGGLMVYDVSSPAQPQFVDYLNTRDNMSFAGDNGPEGVLFIPAADSPDGFSYVVTANELSGTLAVFRFLTKPVVGFASAYSHATEGADSLAVQVVVEQPGVAATVHFSAVAAGTASEGQDFSWLSDSISLPPTTGPDTFLFHVALPDNTDLTGGKYLILKVDSTDQVSPGSSPEHILLIRDNDVFAPVMQSDPFVQMRHLGSFEASPTGGSAEISGFDPVSKRLFTTNIDNNSLEILDFSDPNAVVHLLSVDMSPYGAGINSVAVKNGLVAASIEGVSTGEPGSVAFFDADGQFLNSVPVGFLPDMVTFTNDGSKVLTANEGEPNSDYSIDPPGSISVIHLEAGVQQLTPADVTHLSFDGFNDQLESLRAQGVRIFGPNASVANDLEPEYICISSDDKSALVTLQENNALAIVDLQNLMVTAIQPLGYKDHRLPANILDASDRGGRIFSAAWNVKGAYMPDAIECFTVDGVTYAVTANEGDAREYGDFVESQRLKDLVLDPTAFPDAAYLQQDVLLGRLNVSGASGDTDGDGDLDEIYAFGGRSFSIWNVSTGELVWDSGDDLEAIVAGDPVWGAFFNASNGNTPSFRNRSDDKGPEPEAVSVVTLDDRVFAFIGLERIGGVMAYEITDPTSPVFIQYLNTREIPGGDLGPEGLLFIPRHESPNGRNLLVVSNEISGTVSVIQLDIDRTHGGDLSLETFDYIPESSVTVVQGDTIFDGGISGLHYIPGTNREFLAVSDRGPNVDAGNHPNASGATLLFPAPDYAPRITRFSAENGQWNVQSVEPVRRPDATPVSGLPLPAGAGATGEIAWADTTPAVLNPDIWGLDAEGIVEDNFGNIWLCDEYGASVWKVNKATNQVVKRYTPFPTEPEDVSLPAPIGLRKPNRGFEGIAVTPNGHIYAILQSVANNPDAAAGNNGRLLRLVGINPETDAVTQYAYEINPPYGQIRSRDWKVGDLVAVNNQEFLLVEHAERNGWNAKVVYKVDIADATPLPVSDDFGGLTLEQVGSAADLALFGVHAVQKLPVLDLLEAGWDLSHDKPEGLTILDAATIALVNDNDFGIASPAADGSFVFTGKSTRLYIYGLADSLDYVPPYCSFDLPAVTLDFCEGDTAAVDAGSGFSQYLWSNGSTGSILQSSLPGTYGVTVTNDAGCKASDSITLVAKGLPLVSLEGDTTLCPESLPWIVTATDTLPGTAFAWVTGDTSASVVLSTAGSYAVVATNVAGCSVTASVDLGIWPSPQLDLGPDRTSCQGDVSEIQADSGFVSYLWSNGSQEPFLLVGTAGTFSVTVTDGNGCIASDSLDVAVSPLPTADLGPNQTICQGDTVVLDAGDSGSDRSFLWNTGAMSPLLPVTQTGTYSVLVTDLNTGCTNLDAMTLFVNPAPVVSLGNDTVFNVPTSYVLDPGPGFLSYAWSDGSGGQTLTVTESGAYSVTVTDQNGCQGSATVHVTIEPSRVRDANDRHDLVIYPNPAATTVSVRLPDTWRTEGRWVLSDAVGRPVLSATLSSRENNSFQVPVAELPAGIYTLSLLAEGARYAGKLVVVR